MEVFSPFFFTVEEIQRILTFFLKTGRLFFDSFLKGSILIRINPLFRIHIHRNMNPNQHCILYICFYKYNTCWLVYSRNKIQSVFFFSSDKFQMTCFLFCFRSWTCFWVCFLYYNYKHWKYFCELLMLMVTIIGILLLK